MRQHRSNTLQRHDRIAGLSLLEVVIAAAILAALSVASLLVIVPIARQSRLSQEITTANIEVQRVLERVHSTPFNELTTVFPDGQKITLDDLENGEISIDYDNPEGDPVTISVTVEWDAQDGGSFSRSFLTVRTE